MTNALDDLMAARDRFLAAAQVFDRIWGSRADDANSEEVTHALSEVNASLQQFVTIGSGIFKAPD